MIAAIYSIARALAWWSAASKGPVAVAKRAGRGVAYKSIARVLRKL